MAAFKIASSELCKFPLLKFVASCGKPIFLSVGMAYAQEIRLALKLIQQHWPKSKGPLDLTLLYCVSVYPSPYAMVNLRKMVLLAKEFGVPVGFSDHSVGIELPIAAVGLGASVIEKHLKLPHDDHCPDAPVSLGPAEFKKMVNSIRNVESSLRQDNDGLSAQELKTRRQSRKGLVSAGDLKKGHRVSEEDILLRKPSGPLGLERYFDLIGTILVKDIRSGAPFTFGHFRNLRK